MDISLNITNEKIPQIKSYKEKSQNSSPNFKQKFPSDSGFSFQFTKNDKIKAVVARRRPIINKTQLISPKKEIKTILPLRRKNYVSLQPEDKIDDENKDFTDDIDVNLSLNVSTSTKDVVQKKKQKVSRDERLEIKRLEKTQRTQKIDRQMTNEEIDEGIKKFSELPKQRKVIKKATPSIRSVNLFHNNPETKILGQRLVKPITEKIFTGASISSLDLHPHCVKNLADILNITELTTVQQQAIPKALEGRDILVRSQTGSGKTLAYALPVVQKLQEIRPKLTRLCGIQAVIIVPTRELAIQTYEVFIKLLKPFTWIVSGLITGGEKRKAEKARLRKGINILVGTPGRLCDHLLHTESFKLDKVKWLVLDEADRLLELGYERDVKKIVEAINEHKAGIFANNNDEKNPFKTKDGEISSNNNMNNGDKNPFKTKEIVKTQIAVKINNEVSDLQRLLLSATLTSEVQKLAGLTLRNPLFIDTSDEDHSNIPTNGTNYETAVQEAVEDGKLVIPATVQLTYVVVPPKLRLVTLTGILAKECNQNKRKALVFMSTMEMVNYHHDLMNETLTRKILDEEDENSNDSDNEEEPLLSNLRFFKLHGSMTQQERSGVFKAFRETKTGVLLTTDVSGRGIDVPEVDLVIQYSPPQKIQDFVHRVGRTGRAGRSGRSIMLLGPNETDFIRFLEDKRIRISQSNMDDYLKVLDDSDSSSHNIQEAASNLQHKFEVLLNDDNEMHERACKAFVSWVRFYSAFPKDLKQIFNVKVAHMGHYAKSFALREPPKSFARQHAAPKPILPTNRLTYSERNSEKLKHEKTPKKRLLKTTVRNGNRLHKFLPKSISLSTSEYDSGMPAIKRKRK